MIFCKTCGKSTYNKKQRTFRKKYCSIKCRSVDSDYLLSISALKKNKTIDEVQKKKISESMIRFYERKRVLEGVNYKTSKTYRMACQFDFNVYDFPFEFELNLIEEYGWYSPAHFKNNLLGVSRDHMISISFGYKNNISPLILKHPANCKLLLQKDNASKRERCSINYNDLVKRIEQWDIRYGAIV